MHVVLTCGTCGNQFWSPTGYNWSKCKACRLREQEAEGREPRTCSRCGTTYPTTRGHFGRNAFAYITVCKQCVSAHTLAAIKARPPKPPKPRPPHCYRCGVKYEQCEGNFRRVARGWRQMCLACERKMDDEFYEKYKAEPKFRQNMRSASVSAFRKRRRDADRTACEVCGWLPPRGTPGRRSLFHAHHCIPVTKGGSDHAENLLVLCPNHHALAHRMLRKVDLTDVGEAEARANTVDALRRLDRGARDWLAPWKQRSLPLAS